MPAHLSWPELLEEQAYLVQILSEAAHDPGALEQTRSILEAFRADLRFCINKVAELEREARGGFAKSHEAKHSTSSASRFFHRVAGSIGSDDVKDKDKEDHEMQQERLLAAWTRKRTLGIEVKNLEVKVQLLERRTRHHEELQQRLQALYDRIFDGPKPASPEEDEAEEETRRAERNLHQVQKTLDRHKATTALLEQGDFALNNLAPHLLAVNAGGGAQVASQVEFAAAKTCAVQATVVVEQAKRLDPGFFDEERGGDVLKASWLSDVFRTKPASDGDSIPSPSLSALQSHHKALLSLLGLARQKLHEYDTAMRRAAQRYEEARGWRDGLRRRVLQAYANAETGDLDLDDEPGLGPALSTRATVGHGRGEVGGGKPEEAGLEKDGTARMRDVTAGLDKILVVATQRTGVSQGDKLLPVVEERSRRGSEEGRRPVVVAPQPRVVPPVQPDPRLAPRPHSQPRVSPQSQNLAPIPVPSAVGSPRSPNPNLSTDSLPQIPVKGPSGEMTARQLQRSPSRPPRLEAQQSQSNVPSLQEPSSSSRTRLPSPMAPTHDTASDMLDSRAAPAPPRPPKLQVEPSAPPRSSPGEAVPRQTRPSPQPPAGPQLQPQSQLHVSRAREPSPNAREPSPGAREPSPSAREPSPNTRALAPNPSPPTNSARPEDMRAQAPTSRDPPRPALPKTQLSAPAAHPLPKRPEIHGILKAAVVAPPAAPRRSTADSADPWGVRAAAAPSSRPQPKIKTMFHLWRNAEALKSDKPDKSGKSEQGPPPVQAPEPPTPPKALNPRAATQKLRFVDAVELIPRPAVDSDPYEDDEEEDTLPPSPRRGSMIWRQEGEGEGEGSDDGGDGPASDLGSHGPAGRMDEEWHEQAGRDRSASNASAMVLSPASISGSSSHYNESAYAPAQSSANFRSHPSASTSSTITPFATPSHSDAHSLQWQEGAAIPVTPAMSSADALARQRSHQAVLGDGRSPSLRRAHAALGDMVPEFTEPLRLPKLDFRVEGGEAGASERKRREAPPPSSWGGDGTAAPQALSSGSNYSERSRAPRNPRGSDGGSYDDLHIDTRASKSSAVDVNSGARLTSPSAPNLVLAPSTSPPNTYMRAPHAAPMTRGESGLRSDHELVHAMFPSPPRSTVSDRDLLFTN